MTLKNDEKVEKLTFYFKIDIRKLTTFAPSTQKYHKWDAFD